MQWCQRLEADYGMDPRIWQSLDGPPLRLSSKLRLCNSLHGHSAANSKKGQIVHTLVFVLSLMCFNLEERMVLFRLRFLREKLYHGWKILWKIAADQEGQGADLSHLHLHRKQRDRTQEMELW